ncbi:MAG: hypothetical protein GX558_03230 [Clostridiales bacterium]|nr:hypothetical protein [Clostridiales bacterium]
MARMQLDIMGVDYRNEPGHVADHINQDDQYTLMCFAAPVQILTADGMERAGVGDCMLQMPSTHMLHYAPNGPDGVFANDWIHFRAARDGRAARRPRDAADAAGAHRRRAVSAHDDAGN